MPSIFTDPFQLESFEVIGSEEITVSIRESISTLSYSASTSVVAEIQFSVYDPGFRMMKNRFFTLGREVRFNERVFLITRITARLQQDEMVDVLARAKESQILRYEKGRESYGNVSPTVVAAAVADSQGLEFVGEPSPTQGTIQRTQTDFLDESTFDMLRRLGHGLQFHMFTSGRTLFFASQNYINLYGNQPSVVIRWPPELEDPFQPLSMQVSKSDENQLSAVINGTLVRDVNSVRLYPGMAVEVPDLVEFPGKFMIDSVSMNVSPGTPVAFRATRTTEDGLSITPREIRDSIIRTVGSPSEEETEEESVPFTGLAPFGGSSTVL